MNKGGYIYLYEKNIFVYDRKNKIATLNGKDIHLKFEQFVDSSLVESKLQHATRAYTPIYMTIQSISFDEAVNRINSTATVIGGVIAVVSLNGLILQVLQAYLAIGLELLV